jgi:hypothetical protein
MVLPIADGDVNNKKEKKESKLYKTKNAEKENNNERPVNSEPQYILFRFFPPVSAYPPIPPPPSFSFSFSIFCRMLFKSVLFFLFQTRPSTVA